MTAGTLDRTDTGTQVDSQTIGEMQQPCDIVKGITWGSIVIDTTNCESPATWGLAYVMECCGWNGTALRCDGHHDELITDPTVFCTSCKQLTAVRITSAIRL